MQERPANPINKTKRTTATILSTLAGGVLGAKAGEHLAPFVLCTAVPAFLKANSDPQIPHFGYVVLASIWGPQLLLAAAGAGLLGYLVYSKYHPTNPPSEPESKKADEVEPMSLKPKFT
jgi:hypothetical protein